jgi:hypothetical protein
MSAIQDRMLRAAKLDVQLYEEVEGDSTATGQAALVVVLASLAAGIGSISITGISGILFGTITALLAWVVWAYIVYFVGTKLLPEPQTAADPGELLRTIGFASSPGVIRVIGIIPGLLTISSVVASIWMLVAMVIAVRQALDYKSTGRAIGVCLIGWVIQFAVTWLLFKIFGYRF